MPTIASCRATASARRLCTKASKSFRPPPKTRPDLDIHEALVGGAAYDATGHPLPPETLALAQHSDAVYFGAVGGPKYDAIPDPNLRPERGALLPLRQKMGLYANLRPCVLYPSLAAACPLRPDLVEGGFDILVVRELTGGLYFGQPKGWEGDRAVDTCVYTREEITRIAHVAFQAAQKRGKRLLSVDKANVLETSRLWRETVTNVAKDYPDVELSHQLVDATAMDLVRRPQSFDVIVTENLFGDILSDEAAQLTGSLGMLPSASLGQQVAHSACTSQATAAPPTSSEPAKPTRLRPFSPAPCSCATRSARKPPRGTLKRRRPHPAGRLPHLGHSGRRRHEPCHLPPDGRSGCGRGNAGEETPPSG